MIRALRAILLSLLAMAPAFAQDVVLPDGKGKEIVQQACADCHGLEQIVNNPMSAEKWRTTVEKMVKKGASISPEQLDLVVDYLASYFASDKVNVNTATAQELQDALALTSAEANAIVEYRRANGNFKDLAGLGKVSGVDAKKLEGKKDQIEF